ncbi:MAG: hypothetical protein PF574_02210 [Candidatus Delongbacteria bacterium]|jgi:hypothetical protein|nr:hypothetical protein [Candidatus Delongbacteria bacterium]
MKKIIVLLILLVSSFLTAISDSPKEEVKVNPHKITQEELHNIAINYYHYNFEEGHEWKGIRVDSTKSVIKDIFPYEENGITFFYIINFNPCGHIVVPAYNIIFSPGCMNSSSGTAKRIKSIDDKKMFLGAKRIYHKIKKAILNQNSGEYKTNEKERALWEKLNVPPVEFHERVQYENNTYQPDWWLEKKQANKIQTKSE